MSDIEALSDEALMIRVIEADHGAFSALVRRHTQRFYACAFRTCGNVQMAEDAVQESFLKLWQSPEIWDSSKSVKFTTWFYRIVVNKTIDMVRKVRPSSGSDVLEFLPDEQPDQRDDLIRREEERVVEEAIAGLPERQRVALNLCFYEGLSNKEAAEIMDVGVKALESLLMRAKSNLRDILLREEEKRYG